MTDKWQAIKALDLTTLNVSVTNCATRLLMVALQDVSRSESMFGLLGLGCKIFKDFVWKPLEVILIGFDSYFQPLLPTVGAEATRRAEVLTPRGSTAGRDAGGTCDGPRVWMRLLGLNHGSLITTSIFINFGCLLLQLVKMSMFRQGRVRELGSGYEEWTHLQRQNVGERLTDGRDGELLLVI